MSFSTSGFVEFFEFSDPGKDKDPHEEKAWIADNWVNVGNENFKAWEWSQKAQGNADD